MIAYEVDAEAKRIVLRTRYEGCNPPEYTTIFFDEVEAYLLEFDNFETILRGIGEIPMPEFLEENREVLEAGTAYAWPGSWNSSLEAVAARFDLLQVKPFELASSYGMAGWVVCRQVRIEPSAQ